jgi:hypothetical protein
VNSSAIALAAHKVVRVPVAGTPLVLTCETCLVSRTAPARFPDFLTYIVPYPGRYLTNQEKIQRKPTRT